MADKSTPQNTPKSPRRPAARKPRRAAAKPADKTFGVKTLAAGAAAIGIGGALLAMLFRGRTNPAEHAAPDLALDAPRPGTDRAPEAFRPDPTAVPTKAEYDSLRPATAPAPSMVQGSPGLNGATAN